MKVLITRSRLQASAFAAALAEDGFECIFLPVIEIKPISKNPALDQAIQEITSYEWVVFTSANAVKIFFERLYLALGEIRVKQLFSTIKTAVIGPKTAAALQQYGVTPDFMPLEYVAEAILPGMGYLHGCRVLLPRGEAARSTLPEEISAAGGIVDQVSIYHTLQPLADPRGLAALRSGVDVVTLTSSSTVRNFVAIVKSAGMDPLHLPGQPSIACIGPITANTARELGLTKLLVAGEYTIEGLVKLIRSIAKEKQ